MPARGAPYHLLFSVTPLLVFSSYYYLFCLVGKSVDLRRLNVRGTLSLFYSAHTSWAHSVDNQKWVSGLRRISMFALVAASHSCKPYVQSKLKISLWSKNVFKGQFWFFAKQLVYICYFYFNFFTFSGGISSSIWIDCSDVVSGICRSWNRSMSWKTVFLI